VALLLPLAIVGLMYFFLLRPQQKRVKDQQALVSATEVGDEVMTSSGIYGIVTELEDDTFLIEIAEGIEMRMARGAIAKILTKGAATGASPTTPSTPTPEPTEPSEADDARDNS
jgi:preprotein translocase subunit YajC